MRIPILISLAAVVVLAVSLASAADSTKPTVNTGPTEINGKSLKQWIDEIDKTKQPDPGLRHRAIQAVTLFDPEAASKEAAPELLKAISDSDTSIRVNALIALAVTGIHESLRKDALPKLVDQLRKDSQGVVRLHAIIVIGEMDSGARAAVPELINWIRDINSYETRKQAVIALGRAGQSDGEKTPVEMTAVQALLATVNGGIYADRSVEVRLVAVMSLGQMGIPATSQGQQILKDGLKAALKDPSKIVQLWAYFSLWNVDGFKDEHLLGIVGFLKSKDPTVRMEAIKALGTVGPKATKVAYKDIAELLVERDPGLIAAACWTLSEWGDAADAAIPAVQKIMDDKTTDERLKPILQDTMKKLKGDGKPKK